MISKRFFLILFISSFIGCKTNSEKDNKTTDNKFKTSSFQNSISKINSRRLPINEKKIIKCINKIEYEFKIDTTCVFLNKNNLSKFINNSLSNTRKKDEFYLANEKTFYPIFRYKFSNRTQIIGLLTEYWLEDRRGVSLQINSFDEFGEQKDYLIILNRYNGEILYKRNFEIYKNIVKLTDITIDINEYNEAGDIIFTNKKINPKIIKKTITYTINDKGFFKEKKNE